MGDDGAEHLALALRVAKTHKVGLINLSGNDITDKGAQAIVHALQGHHDEVNTLFLAQNQIGATGARCLAKFIRQSHNLRSLSLSENPINDEGASIISGALPGSTTLSTLS